MIYNKLHISVNSNSKLTAIPSINLPPVVTCRPGAPCCRDCYACRGNFRFDNVKKSAFENLIEYQTDPRGYFDSLRAFLSRGVVAFRFFRWHASGDIVDMEYLRGMVRVARACRGVRFLCFTKKYEFINEYLTEGEKIPGNLVIVFSAWSRDFRIPNPHGLPVAYVDFGDARTPAIPGDALPCGGDCVSCLQCFRLKNGGAVVFKKH